MSYVKTVWQDLPDRTTPITAARLNNAETQYDSAMAEVNARARLLVGANNSANDFANLQAAVDEAATAGAPLLLRGNFQLTGGSVAPSSSVTINADTASFFQLDSLRSTFVMPAGSSFSGGRIVGKGTDWVNTTAVYAASAIVVAGANVSVSGVKAESMAGAGVYMATPHSGMRVIDCDFTGVGSGVIPASTGQYSGGVVLNTNAVTDFVIRGGRFSGFAQGIVTGTVFDFFIGGGLQVSAAGQHGVYLGAADGGTLSGLLVDQVPLQGIKVQLSNSTAVETDLLTIGDVAIRGNGSHGILVTNVDTSPTVYNRRVSIHDVVIEHAVGGGGDSISIDAVNNVVVHDVVGVGGWRGIRAQRGSGLNLHHNTFSGYAKSGIFLNDVTSSDVDSNVLRDGSTLNDAAEEYGIDVRGATSAELRFANNHVVDAAGNTKYGVYVLAGDLTTMSFIGNQSRGVSDYGFRSATTTSTRLWLGNDLGGTLGKFFNTPTNAANVADTSGAALAALEAEVNKLKARMRLFGVMG